MRAWIEQPLVNVAAINARLDGVEEPVGGSRSPLYRGRALKDI